MYVSVHVVLGLDPPLNGVKQLHTAGSNLDSEVKLFIF